MREFDPGAPTIYLDFDGVLHALGEPALDDDFKLVDNPRLFGWREVLEALLQPWPAVQIIVSSDWRALFADESLMALLGPGLGGRFVGVVEVRNRLRAAEVQEDAAIRGVERWISLDDHPSVQAAEAAGDGRYVACQPDLGLTEARVQDRVRAWLEAEGGE